ncbi:DUF5670 family protein [Novosphingobium colocasiae]
MFHVSSALIHVLLVIAIVVGLVQLFPRPSGIVRGQSG